MAWFSYREYVPVAVRRKRAAAAMKKLRAKGKRIDPVEIAGRTIARSFWGRQWCDHMESFHDFRNRLDRGKRYVRNGSVCHLEIRRGKVVAIVSGSELYNVSVKIRPLGKKRWAEIVERCRGRIGSMLELLQGRLSDEVMRVVTDPDKGLLPQPGQIDFDCDCPDYAMMCKHVAAVFYGIGSRLDHRPELLFLLRGVEADELISAEMAIPPADKGAAARADDQLADIFDIELDQDTPPPAPKAAKDRPVTRKSGNKGGASQARTDGVGQVGRESAASSTRKKGRPSRMGRGRAAGKPPAARGGGHAAGKSRRPFRPTAASIARLRKRLGMTVAEFARAVGVTQTSVYRWESSKGKLNLQTRPREALDRLHQQTK